MRFRRRGPPAPGEEHLTTISGVPLLVDITLHRVLVRTLPSSLTYAVDVMARPRKFPTIPKVVIVGLPVPRHLLTLRVARLGFPPDTPRKGNIIRARRFLNLPPAPRSRIRVVGILRLQSVPSLSTMDAISPLLTPTLKPPPRV